MSEQIGSYDAKTKLPELLRRVEQGESITITNRGKAVADIVPSASNQQQKVMQAIKGLRHLALGHSPVDESTIKVMKEDGRR